MFGVIWLLIIVFVGLFYARDIGGVPINTTLTIMLYASVCFPFIFILYIPYFIPNLIEGHGKVIYEIVGTLFFVSGFGATFISAMIANKINLLYIIPNILMVTIVSSLFGVMSVRLLKILGFSQGVSLDSLEILLRIRPEERNNFRRVLNIISVIYGIYIILTSGGFPSYLIGSVQIPLPSPLSFIFDLLRPIATIFGNQPGIFEMVFMVFVMLSLAAIFLVSIPLFLTLIFFKIRRK